MPRYIDADKAEKDFEETFCKHCNSYDGAKCRACDMKDGADIFNDAPTEDVQPVVHAKWFLDGNSSSEEEKCYRCSNCKAVLEEDYKWRNHNYCYHCGARMDKKEERYVRDIFMTR